MKAAPIVIAHRGASGYRPEHTIAAYRLAIDQGADFIEPDLVMTRDGHLIARHDNVLDLTTDVASRPEFADRKTTKQIDGKPVTGWFSEDFTLEETRTLRAVERIPDIRPANAAYDGRFAVPTLEEIIELVAWKRRTTGRLVGLYPEIKHPTYFRSIGLPMERRLVDVLHEAGYRTKRDAALIQCFEVEPLKRLNRMTDVRLVQLLWKQGQPFDVEQAGGALTFDDMAKAEGLRTIARYADGVGPEKNHFIMPLNERGEVTGASATSFVADAHAAGLLVHAFTFRAEREFLPSNFDSLEQELRFYFDAGVDGVLTDHPDRGVAARAGQTEHR